VDGGKGGCRNNKGPPALSSSKVFTGGESPPVVLQGGRRSVYKEDPCLENRGGLRRPGREKSFTGNAKAVTRSRGCWTTARSTDVLPREDLTRSRKRFFIVTLESSVWGFLTDPFTRNLGRGCFKRNILLFEKSDKIAGPVVSPIGGKGVASTSRSPWGGLGCRIKTRLREREGLQEREDQSSIDRPGGHAFIFGEGTLRGEGAGERGVTGGKRLGRKRKGRPVYRRRKAGQVLLGASDVCGEIGEGPSPASVRQKRVSTQLEKGSLSITRKRE